MHQALRRKRLERTRIVRGTLEQDVNPVTERSWNRDSQLDAADPVDQADDGSARVTLVGSAARAPGGPYSGRSGREPLKRRTHKHDQTGAIFKPAAWERLFDLSSPSLNHGRRATPNDELRGLEQRILRMCSRAVTVDGSLFARRKGVRLPCAVRTRPPAMAHRRWAIDLGAQLLAAPLCLARATARRSV